MSKKRNGKKRRGYQNRKNNSINQSIKNKVNADIVIADEEKVTIIKNDKKKSNQAKNKAVKYVSHNKNQIEKKKKEPVKKENKIRRIDYLICDKFSKEKNRQNVFIWCLIIGLFVFALSFYYYFLTPTIDLMGKSTIVIDYGKKYKELGYKAFYQGKDITSKVKVISNVKPMRIGTYKIYYQVKYGSFNRTVMRRVIIKDISPPRIHFSDGKGTIYVCPQKKYSLSKYKAFDNHDGDITNKVVVKKSKNYVLYEVFDKALNMTKVKRNIRYIDNKKAKITLSGGDVYHAFVGEEFVEPGYKAIDNCDGDITKNVEIKSNVDTKKVGDYEIKYSVRDKAGNKSSVVRKVKVLEHDKNGSVYLTFDDGPKEGTTDVILDILKEEGVKATFFVTNSGPDELIKREADEGHTVALHTSSHDYSLVYSSDDAYFHDLYSISDRVKRITGRESKFIRFPGGSSNTVSRRYSSGIMSRLTSEVINRGFKYYDWNLSSGDAEAGLHTSSEIYHNVVDHLSKTRVNMVLLHDIKPYTRDALRDIIKYCKDNGYTLEAIRDSTEMIKQTVNN